MPASPYMRTIPYRGETLEDVSIQYLPGVKQLLITFYYRGYQFALICVKINDEFVPVKMINNLKKDSDDIRCQLVLTLLSDHYKEIYKTIAESNPSFQLLVEKEFSYWNRKI